MHHRIRLLRGHSQLGGMSILQIALHELRARIERGAMAFAQVIENGNAVALVEQQLSANASDIAGPTDNENFHSRENRRPAPLINPKCDLRNSSPKPTSNLRFSWRKEASSKR